MPLHKIHLHHLRIFDSLVYEPGPKMNFVVGANGSGKSTILEAIAILSTGRSFRTSSLVHAISHQASSFTIHAQLQVTPSAFIDIGFQRDRHQASPIIQMNQKREVKISELAKVFPVKLLCVDNYQLLRRDPQERRQLLDWGVFHSEPTFYTAWQTYHKLLKHRNKLLKQGVDAETLHFWTAELVTAGQLLHDCRVRFMMPWRGLFTEFLTQLLPLEDVTLDYAPGWEAVDLQEAFQKSFLHDQRVGFSHVGPHRADLLVTIQNRPAKQVLSLGQQKLLVTALHLSQACLLRQQAEKETVFLLDDLPAELDRQSQQRVSHILEQLNAQTFISCVDERSTQDLKNTETQIFHVEPMAVETA